jgi:hypothetical protein
VGVAASEDVAVSVDVDASVDEASVSLWMLLSESAIASAVALVVGELQAAPDTKSNAKRGTRWVIGIPA